MPEPYSSLTDLAGFSAGLPDSLSTGLSDCLSGIRVLDLSQYIPGPFATRLLADLGADVLKIEPPHGDPMRSFGPCDATGQSVLYQHLNQGKAILTLDLKTAAGQAELRRALDGADVVLESFRPGTLARLGFDPAQMVRDWPSLVVCSLSGFGQTGPARLRAGHDMTYTARTGSCAYSVGAADAGHAAPPALPFPPLSDHAGALFAVSTLLAALFRRQRSGRGAWLDVSLFESLLALNSLGLGWRKAGSATGQENAMQRDADLLTGGAAFYRLYRCADGRYAALAPLEPKFWAVFCQAVQRPDWESRQAEPLPQRALGAELAALFASQPLAHWSALLDPLDCCFEAVAEGEEPLHDPHVLARGIMLPSGEALLPCYVNGHPPRPRGPVRWLSSLPTDWAAHSPR